MMISPDQRIKRVGGVAKDAYTYIPVVIIGAGESGICMGSKLQYKLGFDQFRIFERRSGLGGTWYANTYPGIACDVPAVLYSFSFAQNPTWTSPYPSGTEIVNYLYEVSSKYKILDKIQCDTNVKSIRWLEHEEQWELVLEHLGAGIGDLSSAERAEFEKENSAASTVLREEVVRAKVVVSAVGGLVEPKAALDLPGKKEFQGHLMHTARWDSSINLKGKNVVVVGTGCSAAQVIPQLTKPHIDVAHVTQLMRSPPWTVPTLTPEQQVLWRKWMPVLSKNIPLFQRSLRKLLFGVVESEWFDLFAPTKAASKGRELKRTELLEYMHKMVPEKYHDMLTPDYEVFCKRRIVDDGWFRTLQDERVELTTQAPKALTATGLILSEGQVYPKSSKAHAPERTVPCDVLIMANGYRTNEWLHPLNVKGRNGVSLHDQWEEQGGAGAYLTLASHNFPNYFMAVGPNSVTGHSSVILASENATNYITNFVGPILKGEVSTFEVKAEAENEWTRKTQASLSNSVYNIGGTTNWYVKDGWNSTMYPSSQVDFWARCQFVRWGHWHARYTGYGLLTLWRRRAQNVIALALLFIAVRHAKRYGIASLRNVVLSRGRDLLTRVLQRLRQTRSALSV